MKFFKYFILFLTLFLAASPSLIFCSADEENVAEVLEVATEEGSSETIDEFKDTPADECISEEMMEEKNQKIKQTEETIADLKQKYEELQQENKLLREETAKSNQKAKEELNALKTENAQQEEEIESLKSLVEEKQGQLEEASSALEKKKEELEKASQQTKEAAVDSAKVAEYEDKVAALETSKAKGEKEAEQLRSKVSELEARVEELQAASADSENLSARIEELEKTLKNDVRECRAETSSLHEELKFHRQGVHIVALYRASEHLSAAKTASLTFYRESVLPNLQLAYGETWVLYARAGELYVSHLRPKFAELWTHIEPHTEKATTYYTENVKPVYQEKVAPLVEVGLQKGAEISAVALEKGDLALQEFQNHYADFRDRGIRTLKRNEAFAPHAEQIFDGCVNTILGLTCLLLAGPVIRFALGLVKFVVYLPLRILCCVFCCRCGCGSRKGNLPQASRVTEKSKDRGNKNMPGSKAKQK